MGPIKKSHDTVGTLDTLRLNCANCVKSAMQIFLCQFQANSIRRRTQSLVIPYILFNHCLIITLTNMAKFTTSNGIDCITGALKKTTEQGVNHITVTKKKHFHDPLTGEETGIGPNEIFIQNKRDYDEHPLTPGEKAQRGNWQQACRDAQLIIRDKSHPRFMELYNRWRAQLSDPEPYKQFAPFVRAVLVKEQ